MSRATGRVCKVTLLGALCSIGCSCARAVAGSASPDDVRAVADRWARDAGWMRYEVREPRFAGDAWDVLVVELPRRPGGHVVLVVTPEGEVREVLRGY